MQGKIIKGIAGFYYVNVVESGLYECKAKGSFRKNGIKPLVGDEVELEVLDEEEKIGNVTKILPRKNELIRPAVAQYRSGTGCICGNGTKAALQSAGSISGYDGAETDSGHFVF